MTKISRDNFNKKELVNNLKSKFGTSNDYGMFRLNKKTNLINENSSYFTHI